MTNYFLLASLGKYLDDMPNSRTLAAAVGLQFLEQGLAPRTTALVFARAATASESEEKEPSDLSPAMLAQAVEAFLAAQGNAGIVEFTDALARAQVNRRRIQAELQRGE